MISLPFIKAVVTKHLLDDPDLGPEFVSYGWPGDPMPARSVYIAGTVDSEETQRILGPNQKDEDYSLQLYVWAQAAEEQEATDDAFAVYWPARRVIRALDRSTDFGTTEFFLRRALEVTFQSYTPMLTHEGIAVRLMASIDVEARTDEN